MLSLTNLAVARGGVTVLRGLTLTVTPGQALILRGPNGSGKTTLLRTLAGLQPPAGGTCDLPPDSVAYAAHADGLKSTLTVAENLSFWSQIYGGPVLDPALTALNLTQLAGRRAGELSAGQKRRLGLARLLVTGRPVWLLDEPTVSLDVASVAMFAEVVRAHLATGGLAVIATHVDLGLPEAVVLDLDPYRTLIIQSTGFDEAFA
jgi:heme exporter protein A